MSTKKVFIFPAPTTVPQMPSAMITTWGPAMTTEFRLLAMSAGYTVEVIGPEKVETLMVVDRGARAGSDAIAAKFRQAKHSGAKSDPATDLKYAQDLARSLQRKHYPEVQNFDVYPDMWGVISQIDNMLTGLERKSHAT